ncbi:uncharacterized protein Tco025E_09602 [Trypanosoma conorhini]|uniref:Uncharacterized protein n=1 Tax=Trypanosoma conorhini TaxID=83891 RepID=A0A422MUM7_9TRYP|nr:uncharacterized protein Tco025E_09602 [Trypanosoma conorhini]RNE96923.1 hypothetical protein Tco025E_09602 [Trypanosoma conorhini]
MNKRTSLVLLLLAFLLVVPFAVRAQHSLECQNVWKGPDADNDIVACLSNKDRLIGQWRLLVLPVMNVVLLAVLVLSFPLLFLCVLCCRCCCVPDTLGSTKRARCCMWLWMSYALIWSAVMFYLVFFGAGLLIKTAPRLMDDTVSGPLTYFNFTAEKVLDFASDWSTGERKQLDALPLDLTDFTTVHEKAMGFVDMARQYYFNYLDKVSLATYCVSSVGLVLIALILPFACCHCCIPCFPLVLSCLYWVTAVLFAVLGATAGVLAYVATVGCGELELHYARQPGLAQWYAVPYCQRKFNFTNINGMIREKELELSKGACEQLLGVCEPLNETNVLPSKLLAGVPHVINGAQRSKLLSGAPVALNGAQGVGVPGVGAQGVGVPGVGIPGVPGVGIPGASGAQADASGAGVLAAVGSVLGAGGGGGDASQGGGAAASPLAGLAGSVIADDGNVVDLANLLNGDPSAAGGLAKFESFDGLPPGVTLPSMKDMPAVSESLKKALEGRNISADLLNELPGNLGELANMLADASKLKELFTRPLVCGAGLKKKEDCTDFGTMASIIMDTKLKKEIPGCKGAGTYCKLSECAGGCALDFLKSASAMLLSKAEQARNASIALSYARPLLECNFVMDKLAGALTRCDDIRRGTLMLGMGFFVGGIIFGLAIYIALRGACVWGKRFPKLRRKPRER